MPEDGAPHNLDFVHGFDQKPKRRLVDMLESQGMRANQDITFLTNGGEEVRALTERISPCGEQVLAGSISPRALPCSASLRKASRNTVIKPVPG